MPRRDLGRHDVDFAEAREPGAHAKVACTLPPPMLQSMRHDAQRSYSHAFVPPHSQRVMQQIEGAAAEVISQSSDRRTRSRPSHLAATLKLDERD